ncbi:hypothetical protein [Embleya sp. NBC_00896]|uniref:hypothetical protein n=1 Tax=Embleya sp. NBC_00896 TaxID=2975961 RepID=UPI00386C0B5E|nr:hypothetical protein OG928_22125 [Embleya sp. NBC_00896]
MLKTLTAPAMCTRCGEPYVAALSPRSLVTMQVPAFRAPEIVGGRLMTIDDTVCLVERHAPCTGVGNYR